MPFPKTLLLALSTVAPLAAQVATGKPAPEITFDTVLNTPAPIQSLSDLRGSAVLLEFWATWCGPCRAQIPHMNELHATYASRGLVVLGVAFNEKEAVIAPFAKANAMAYPIGIEDGSAVKVLGIQGIPHAFLVDPNGVIVWAGHPAQLGQQTVENALAGARAFGAKLTDQLEPVQMLLDKNQKGRAEALLLVLQKSGKLEPSANELATATLERLQREEKCSLDSADAAASAGKLLLAALQWSRVMEQFEGREAAKTAAEQLGKLGASDDGRRAVLFAKQLAAAAALVREGKLDDAQAAYENIVSAGDADAAEHAKRGLAAIAARRLAETKEPKAK
jgi:cytochrome c biogenesis protein CcmG/thiol:disulfide interchange protein DsbE